MQTKKKKGFINLGNAIIAAMFAGAFAGWLMGPGAIALEPLGSIFMQLIKMLVIPLVAVSIVSGAASLGNTRSAGKVGGATFIYYMVTTIFAVALGLAFGELFQPGTGLDMSQVKSMFSDEYQGRGDIPGFWDTIKGIIPQNPLKSLVDGNLLQILFFCLFFGFGLSTLKKERKESLTLFFDSMVEAMIWMITRVMFLAPLGVFGLMAHAVGTFGFSTLLLVAKLFGVYLLALAIQCFGVYPALIKIFSNMSPAHFMSRMKEAQAVALSTSSSMATLPVTFEVCEEELGVSKETSSFVLPLGATINMDGNAIYYALAAVFFAQMFGIHLGIQQYLAIIFTATVGSIGQAGVPGPTLLVVAVLISANIPVVGLPLLFGADRLFDMLRTAVNITGDASCAVIVDGIRKRAGEAS
ncbi:MAG: dicarboxylate/amino acid:cation symporter [Candidatus Wallbacteria bacterium HGW-Wallbacteria-1]|uniref:Dicarboxylate/amino acid:cation symporter n=1 Tax=Candidatus Wallbacteria bacterium HGW-Wallbacteria-1 TaxID=2013854 RepID=A0A2N1PRB3_9BACT|nr:MAG: dicarboxylate/amino acid:cation symporter [Candidatus Wallbacteria bacterium HGW-Wallbacteria-1]